MVIKMKQIEKIIILEVNGICTSPEIIVGMSIAEGIKYLKNKEEIRKKKELYCGENEWQLGIKNE